VLRFARLIVMRSARDRFDGSVSFPSIVVSMLQISFLEPRLGVLMPLLKSYCSLYELAAFSLWGGLAVLAWSCLALAIFFLMRTRGQIAELKEENERLEREYRKRERTETGLRELNDACGRSA